MLLLFKLVIMPTNVTLLFAISKNKSASVLNNYVIVIIMLNVSLGEDCRLQDTKQSSFLNCRLQERAFWNLVLGQGLTSNTMQGKMGLM